MKRVTTLVGATAIAIAAGGCAVVPAYDVYGPPLEPGFGPAAVMAVPSPVVVQRGPVVIRSAPVVVRRETVVVRPGPGRGYAHGQSPRVDHGARGPRTGAEGWGGRRDGGARSSRVEGPSARRADGGRSAGVEGGRSAGTISGRSARVERSFAGSAGASGIDRGSAPSGKDSGW